MPRLNLLFRHASGAPANATGRIADLNAVFAPAQVSFVAGGADAQDGLTTVNVGRCTATSGPTAAVQALFGAVTLGVSQAVVFLASQILGANTGTTGCASHPPGKPGVVVGRTVGRWVLAHELGHMLGLPHRDTGLMRDTPSQLPGTHVPQLTAEDLDALGAPRALRLMAAAVPRVPIPPDVRVRTLVAQALSGRGDARTPDIIDRVAAAIERRPALLREYTALRRSQGAAVLHRRIGRETRRQTGMVSSSRTARGTSLFTRVAVLRKRSRGSEWMP